MHKRINCYGKFGLLTKNLMYLVCFTTGSLVLSQNVLAYYSSVAVQWNNFKIFRSSHPKVFLGKGVLKICLQLY